MKNWDIFCRVVDNYGDIGVCWRLARQLAREHGVEVRLWVDDLGSCRMLVPEVRTDRPAQHLHGVDLRVWPEKWIDATPGDVVVEAFACDLPGPFVAAMAAMDRPPVWINLEYLSAEAWIEGCHGLSSPHPTLPLVKHFFFPGFTPATGGLLREGDLLAARRQGDDLRVAGAVLTVFLFSYDHPGLAGLLERWAVGATPIRLRLPPGSARERVGRWLDRPLGDGDRAERGSLAVEALPFVPQEGFDTLLWDCDLALVRGEDSFVRAQWAARPFVWQIYPQADEAHRVKLEAFLARYCVGLSRGATADLTEFWRAWNFGGDPATGWPGLISHLQELAAHARTWCDSLENQRDLAENLVKFCSERVK